MIAFEIQLNGKRLCVAGIGDLGTVTAIMTWVRRKAPPEGTTIPDWTAEELNLHVGGIDSQTNENLVWLRHELQVGDAITVRVIETDSVDVPENRWPTNRPRATPSN